MNYCVLFRKYRVVLTCIQMKNRGLLSIQTYVCVSVCLFLKDSLTKVENTPSLFIFEAFALSMNQMLFTNIYISIGVCGFVLY